MLELGEPFNECRCGGFLVTRERKTALPTSPICSETPRHEGAPNSFTVIQARSPVAILAQS